MQRIVITAALLAATVTTVHADNVLSCVPQPYCVAKYKARDAEILKQAATERARQEQEAAQQNARHDAEISAYKQAARDREAIAAADRARADQQAAQRNAELEKRNEEMARLAAMPTYRLLDSYALFAHVKWCHDVRDGYAYKYINDVELERAQIAVKAIVAQTTKEDATINTDDVWQRALRRIEPYIAARNSARDGQIEVCQHSLQELFKLSPAQVYSIAKP